MASIRMTRDLRANINNRAMQAFDIARPEPTASTWLTDRMRDAIINSEPYKFLQESWETKGRQKFSSFGGPPQKLNRQEAATVIVISANGFNKNDSGSKLTFEFVPKIYVYCERLWGDVEVHFEELPANSIQDLRTPCYELHQQVLEHRTNRFAYEKKISDLLDHCSSVKQLLLAWPAGESFVPHESMTRMYTKINRKQRAQEIKEEINFDDTLVNEIVLTAKLVGG